MEANGERGGAVKVMVNGTITIAGTVMVDVEAGTVTVMSDDLFTSSGIVQIGGAEDERITANEREEYAAIAFLRLAGIAHKELQARLEQKSDVKIYEAPTAEKKDAN